MRRSLPSTRLKSHKRTDLSVDDDVTRSELRREVNRCRTAPEWKDIIQREEGIRGQVLCACMVSNIFDNNVD